ncbi:MAG: FAD-dependent oxidoreductase [Candidatus Babeliales bacterium]
MAKIVIVGAGLTGLSAAYHLEKRNFFDFTIFEKEPIAGGLCRSITQNGFTFDFTGHLLHTSDPYFKKFIADIVSFDNLETINRRSFVYSHDTFTRYPFQINLFGLPSSVIAECIQGYVERQKSRHKSHSFPQWVLQNFGSGFARHFFLPFQRKIFSYDLRGITASWTGRFVPKTSLQEMIQGAIQDNTDETIGYNAHFYYPKSGGIQFWIDKLRNQLTTPIHTNYQVEHIDMNKKIIRFTNGHEEEFGQLINTIPLDNFIHMLKEKPNTTFKHALTKLKCNSVVNFNLGINRPNLSEKHWIYFPEKQFPFYRVGFPHNFARSTAPANCSSLYGEFSHVNISKKRINLLLQASLHQIKKLLKIADNEILIEKVIHISHAYVIYNFWREKYLPSLLNQLANNHIFSIGRYGAWKYSSMQEAVLDGKKIAEQLTILPAKTSYYESPTPSQEKQKEWI